MKLYRIKNWGKHYENNRTRELKRMDWVPVPNRHDGDGYTTLVDRSNGAAMLGCWLAILQVASKCDPRGTLCRHNPAGGCGKVRDAQIPHTAESISRITRLPKNDIEKAISILEKECNWLEIIEEYENPAGGCGNPAGGCGKVTMEGKGTEGNEGNGTEIYSAQARVCLHLLNELTGAHFRECETSLKPITARLAEPGVTPEGAQQMIRRQAAMWTGSEMAKYLRPETLFNRTKFNSYYAAKDLPIAGKVVAEQKQMRELIDVPSL